MKRGQSEIIGLVIVVLILVFALIFFVKIKGSDDDNESKLIRFNLRANSALNALMKVNVDTKNQMKDIIQECVDKDDLGSDECVYAKSRSKYYLEDEIGFDENEYSLIVGMSGGNDLFSLGADCRSSISASPFILRNGGKVEFKICT